MFPWHRRHQDAHSDGLGTWSSPQWHLFLAILAPRIRTSGRPRLVDSECECIRATRPNRRGLKRITKLEEARSLFAISWSAPDRRKEYSPLSFLPNPNHFPFPIPLFPGVLTLSVDARQAVNTSASGNDNHMAGKDPERCGPERTLNRHDSSISALRTRIPVVKVLNPEAKLLSCTTVS